MSRGSTGSYSSNFISTSSYGQSREITGMTNVPFIGPQYGQSAINKGINIDKSSIKTEIKKENDDFSIYYRKVPLSSNLYPIRNEYFLGLDLILELQTHDATTHGMCFYYCGVCKMSVLPTKLLEHVSNASHKLKYLELAFPILHKDISYMENERAIENILKLCAVKLSNITGPLQMPVVESSERSKGMEFLLKKANSLSNESYYNTITVNNIHESNPQSMKRNYPLNQIPERKQAKLSDAHSGTAIDNREQKDLHIVNYLSPEFDELAHEWHERWPYRKILLAGDDSCRYFKEGIPAHFPNVSTITKERCSFDDAISIVEESCHTSIDFVLIHAFQWTFVEMGNDATGNGYIKALQCFSQEEMEPMISKIASILEKWKREYPDTIFQFLLPFPINFKQLNGGSSANSYMNMNAQLTDEARFLKYMKEFGWSIERRVRSKWILSKMGNLITINEKIVINKHGFDMIENYMDSSFKPTPKLILRFWKMIYENLCLRYFNKDDRRVTMAGTGSMKCITYAKVKYDVMSKKMRGDPSYIYLSGGAILISCGETISLNSELDQLIPQTIYYFELIPDANMDELILAVDKRGVEGMNLLICSPFQWINRPGFKKLIEVVTRNDQNSKKRFNENISAQVHRLKECIIEWKEKSPDLKVICLLPFPVKYTKTGRSEKEVARDNHFSIVQYNLVKYITECWVDQEVSKVAPFINLSDIVLEGKHNTFVDAKGRPEWNEELLYDGFHILPNFSAIIWGKIQELCLSIDLNGHYLESKMLELKTEQDREMQESSMPNFSSEFNLYTNYRTPYLESINIDPTFYDLRPEFNKVWNEDLKQGHVASSWPAQNKMMVPYQNDSNRYGGRNEGTPRSWDRNQYASHRPNNWEMDAFRIRQQRERLAEQAYMRDCMAMGPRGGFRPRPSSEKFDTKPSFSPLVSLNMICECKDKLGFLGSALIELTRQATEVEKKGQNPMLLLTEDSMNKSLIEACTSKVDDLMGNCDDGDKFMINMVKTACERLMKEIEEFGNKKDEPKSNKQVSLPFEMDPVDSYMSFEYSTFKGSFNPRSGTGQGVYNPDYMGSRRGRSYGADYGRGGGRGRGYENAKSSFSSERGVGRGYDNTKGSYSTERGRGRGYENSRGSFSSEQGAGRGFRGSNSSRGSFNSEPGERGGFRNWNSSRDESTHGRRGMVGMGKTLKNQKRREQRERAAERAARGEPAALPPPRRGEGNIKTLKRREERAKARDRDRANQLTMFGTGSQPNLSLAPPPLPPMSMFN